MIQREIQPDGSLLLAGESCSYRVERLRPGALLLEIRGREKGELGRAPLGEVAAEAAFHPPLHLLLDMTGLSNVSEAVAADWSTWLRANRASLARVDVLAPQTFVRLVVAVAQALERIDGLIEIHKDAASFAARRAAAKGQ